MKKNSKSETSNKRVLRFQKTPINRGAAPRTNYTTHWAKFLEIQGLSQNKIFGIKRTFSPTDSLQKAQFSSETPSCNFVTFLKRQPKKRFYLVFRVFVLQILFFVSLDARERQTAGFCLNSYSTPKYFARQLK